jgi:hypothetical protein
MARCRALTRMATQKTEYSTKATSCSMDTSLQHHNTRQAVGSGRNQSLSNSVKGAGCHGPTGSCRWLVIAGRGQRHGAGQMMSRWSADF